MSAGSSPAIDHFLHGQGKRKIVTIFIFPRGPTNPVSGLRSPLVLAAVISVENTRWLTKIFVWLLILLCQEHIFDTWIRAEAWTGSEFTEHIVTGRAKGGALGYRSYPSFP